jgi:superoxide reductase
MEKNRFFLSCAHCGNVAALVVDKGGALVCCGEEMRDLEPNTVDASKEKHLPVAEATDKGIKVKVGGAPHPMLEEHFIDFLYVKTERGSQRLKLSVGAAPEAEFVFADDKPTEVYAYCNLHGMWKTDV